MSAPSITVNLDGNLVVGCRGIKIERDPLDTDNPPHVTLLGEIAEPPKVGEVYLLAATWKWPRRTEHFAGNALLVGIEP